MFSIGIDRRFTTVAAFGFGAYYAVKSNYSAHDRYCYVEKDGSRRMMVCRVCPGVSCLRDDLEKNKCVPKINPKTKGKRYDSVTDTFTDSERNMFVLFKNDQGYPQWEVVFKILK